MKQKSMAAMAVLAALSVGVAVPHEAEARGGGRLAAGIALGIAGAAIIGGSRYYDGYYDEPYYYDSGYYDSGYYGDGYYDDYGPPYRYYRHHRHYNGSTAFQRNFRGAASDDD